ncbi:hypothetical protein [Phycicoccus duodecadis]|uniref:hypothetical protein n=1 Tax=Phycicoccus duodecadis TaxID=173053 RepID=UPI00117E37E8|nr:hypothetical protein [Phycicoccus duodecadis]
MPSESLLAAARTLLDADPDVAWKLDEHDKLLVTLRSDPRRWFSLDVGSDAFPLDLGQRYSIPEYEYDVEHQPDAVRKQLSRGLAYLHGRGDEVTKKRGSTEISWTLTLPDGTVAKAWRTPLQRLRHRLTGRSRLVQTGQIPG